MRAMRAALKEREQKKAPQVSQQQQSQQAPQGLWFLENTPNAPRVDKDTVTSFNAQSRTSNSGIVTGPPQRGGPTGLARRHVDRPLTDGKDVVDSGMISMATARQLFETYRTQLCPHYPIVPIPESMTADQLRRDKPTLFLSIIAAAATTQNTELSAMLDQEILHTYATKSLVHSEKSLELVQALLVSAVWYHPPNKFGQLKYYEYIHMATSMALDIGIGTRPTSKRSRFGSGEQQLQVRKPGVHPLEDTANPDLSLTPRSRDHSPDTTNLESRRTFLACFIVCAGVSMALRRPNMLRANSYVRECLEYLERSSGALASDRILVAWTKVVLIGDEINIALCYDDPGGVASMSELRTQLMLKDFNKRLESWYVSVPDADMTQTLQIMYYSIRLLLYEVGLHVDHSPEDFKAPYQMGGIQQSDGEDIPTQPLAEAIAESISASHNLLNTYLAMDVESARAFPVFGYVRVSLAAFVLTKLCLSNASSASRIGKVIDRSSLKAESFMDRTILHVRAVVGDMRCRVPAIFLALLFKLRQWCLNPGIIESSPDAKPGWELTQAATPQDDADQQVHAPKYIEGPRIVEHMSSDESSPHTSSEGNVHLAGLTPQSQVFDQTIAPSENMPAADIMSADPQMTTAAGIPQTVPYLDRNDQMELDQNFFRFFGDMNNYTDGVVDANEWPNLDAGLFNLTDNFTWPDASMMDTTNL